MERISQSPGAACRAAAAAWLAALVLAACGGGGTADGALGFSVQLNAPSATPQPRQLSLDFSASGPASAAIAVYRVQWRADAQTDYAPLGEDLAASATTALVELPGLTGLQWVQASVRMQACDAAGACVVSNEQPLAAVLCAAVGYFKAGNAGGEDVFGSRVMLSSDGSTMAVSAWHEDSGADGVNADGADDSAPESGAVYVFARGASGWALQAYLKASNSDANDQFGFALALSADGSTLAIGADGEGSVATGLGGNEADNSAPASGAVYLFARQGGAWSQSDYVKASNTVAGDRFGRSLALSADGRRLAVGALNQGNGGAAYVFERNATGWVQTALLKASNEDVNDWFGHALALSADGATLAVAAREEASAASGVNGDQSDDSTAAAGAVYVFARSDMGVWSQEAYVKASNPGSLDRFGHALAISADGATLAVGAFGEDSAAAGIDGDQASEAANSSGAAYVFVRDAAAWVQQAYLKASNTGASDSFGLALALSADGRALAVGAYNESGNARTVNGAQDNDQASESGAVYLFTRDGSSWAQRAYVKAPDNRARDHFGQSVSLSADGSTLLVGAPDEDSDATGIAGNRDSVAAPESGAVYLF